MRGVGVAYLVPALDTAAFVRGVRRDVARSGLPDEARAWIRYALEGSALERQHQDRIFVLFQRLHTRDDYEGTGMGLSIVKKIVEARGGSVAVESMPGAGSRFTLVLPEATAT